MIATYDFRARATDVVGNVQPFSEAAQATTRVVTYPTATMNPIVPTILTGSATSVTLSWRADTAPGTFVSAYDIRYRVSGGAWQHFLTTSNTTATFTPPTGPDRTYEFEVRGTNNLGQVEPYTGVVEARMYVDYEAPFIVPQSYMPLMFRQAGAN